MADVDISLEDFLAPLRKRVKNNAGEIRDVEGEIRRMQRHPTCIKCHEDYKKKYPGQAFKIDCEGIYDNQDFIEIQKSFRENFPDELTPPIESVVDQDIREIYDAAYWATKYTVAKDTNGEIGPFEPRWYQREMLQCTAKHKVDRIGRGGGKALYINTLVPSPLGWTTMGEISVGDFIFDAEGLPSQVTFVSEIMHNRPCYKVTFSDGAEIIADEEHLWEVWDTRKRKQTDRQDARKSKKIPPAKILTTKQIKDSLWYDPVKPELNYSINVAGPLAYTEKELPIDPYLLGLWLGDGDTSGAGFTTADEFLLEQIKSLGWVVKKNGKDPYRYYIKGPRKGAQYSFTRQLRDLGVLCNKNIPTIYLQGDYNQRLALLQGLMDSDGSADIEGNGAEFSNCNKNISNGIQELLAGLGMKSHTKSRIPICANNGNEGQLSYRTHFAPTIQVFRLPRKADRLKPIVRPTVWRRYITSVESVASVPVCCIAVDNPRHLFLVGKECIPTHNTSSAIAEELHKTFTKSNNDILIVCPADSQSEKWYKELNFQLEESPRLRDALLSQKQQPFRFYKFRNGSALSIFTAGSSSGRGADSVRSQSPLRMHIEEQDYLNEKDWDALGAFLDRYPGKSEFHGTSTPTGSRGKYWEMCTQLPRYKEFYFPISVHPDWSEEMEITCRREAKTEERYQHEYLAEFGDLSQGVFKNTFVDVAKTTYTNPLKPMAKGYDTCYYDPSKEYMLGVDWNGESTGTRLRVVEYNPNTKMVRCVDSQTVDFEGFTVYDSIDAVVKLNKKWHCSEVYIDQGFGHAQDDILRKTGRESDDFDTKKLALIKTIDFGGTLEFNRLKPNRSSNHPSKEELERRTKPFMVEGAVMRFEQKLIEFSSEDRVLEEQLRAYKVKTYSPHGYANTYTAGSIGDHDLDAFMLALLAVEIKHGFYASNNAYRSMAQVSYTRGFGDSIVSPNLENPISTFDAKKATVGVISRTKTEPKSATGLRMDFLRGQVKNGKVPLRGSSNTNRGVPSRTATFTGQLTGRYGSPPNQFGKRR